MKAKQRTLLLLGVLLLLSGAALLLLRRANAQEEAASAAAAEGAIPLSSFSMEELTRITYTYNGETLTLNCAEGGWTLEEDPEYRLSETVCSAMRIGLADLSAKRSLTAQPEEDYGFSEPTVTVQATAAGRTETFFFGAENPVTGDVYLKKEGDEAVYTVAASRAACFEQSKDDLFEAFNPMGLKASDIEAVRYTLADGQTVSLRAVSEPAEGASDAADSSAYATVWRLTEEPEAALDESKVNGILSALSSYVSGQITNADPTQYRLDEPLITAEVTTADGVQRLSYSIGTDGCYLSVDGDSAVYRVDENVVWALAYPSQRLKAEE